MITRDQLVNACRVPTATTARRDGLWEIRRLTTADICDARARAIVNRAIAPYTTYTALLRTTAATLHLRDGEVVMDDTPIELRRHLPILRAAHGRVLVSGLGLGCVLRGLLSQPQVEHVDVVEIDRAIVRLVGGEFLANRRVTLHVGDALTIQWPAGARWDFGWHDVWSEDEPLDLIHARLLAHYRGRCARQGAWQFPRAVKRRWPDPLLGAARAKRAA